MAEVVTERGSAVSRAAESMLRTLCASTVTLRYTSRIGYGDSRQLGLAAPETEDVVVGPALLKNLDTDGGPSASEVLLGAETIAQEMERRVVGSSEELFTQMLGVVRDDKLWRLLGASAVEFAGMEYLYRLKVAE